jgi:hypothetical protein
VASGQCPVVIVMAGIFARALCHGLWCVLAYYPAIASDIAVLRSLSVDRKTLAPSLNHAASLDYTFPVYTFLMV